MRTKEEAHDYRYFPDPDLLPLELDPKWVETIKAGLPELPDVKKARFVSDYGLSPYDAGVLSADMASAAFYETVAKGRDPKIASNWLTGELFAVLNKQNLTIEQSPVSADALGGLLDLLADNTISGRIAKDVFAEMVETGKAAKDIVAAKGLQQITDTGPLEAAADQIIASSPDNVAKYKAGNEKLIGWFVGQVMKATGGKANPGVVNEILKKKLGA
jgi:aspartyl-tRNA(Asn)/glutamyl-tRNA(Gln) amidotransferase subunit B